jgi:hypothetical protein
MDTADKKDILNAWIMVEHLSEGDFPGEKGTFSLDKVQDGDYYSYLSEQLNRQRGKKKGIILYFDIFPFDEVVQMLRRKYHLEETQEDIRTGKKFSFLFCFDKTMQLSEDTVFYSESAYIRSHDGGVPSEKEFREAEAVFINDITNAFNDTADKPEKFNEAFHKLLTERGISAANCRGEAVSNLETGVTNLHSFFIDDLTKAKEISSTNLEAYLFGLGKDEERCNLDSRKDSPYFNEELFRRILAPECYPHGRFPGNPKFALSLMQQVAVNLAIGGDSSHIRSVNGPPGTGKTTLLKDIFAELIVRQAHEMAAMKIRRIRGTEKTTYYNSSSIGVLPASIADDNIVVASSNNGAVQNIVNELPLCEKIDSSFLDELKEADYFYQLANTKLEEKWEKDEDGKPRPEVTEEPGGDKFWGLFSLEGGRSENMKKIYNYINKMYEYLQSDDFEDDEDVYDEFLRAYAKIEDVQEAVKRQSSVYLDIQQEQQKLARLDAAEEAAKNRETPERTAVRREYAQMAAALREAQKERDLLQSEADGTDMLITAKQEALASRIRPGLFASKIEKQTYKMQGELLTSQLLDLRQQLTAKMAAVSQADDKCRELEAQAASIKVKAAAEGLNPDMTPENYGARKKALQQDIQQKSDRLDKRISPLDMRIDYDKLQMSNPWYGEEYRIQQSELFILALRVRRQFLFENRRNLKAASVIWLHQQEYAEDHGELIRYAWEWINLAIPVISSTFASFSSMCRNLGPDSLGHLFIDEAGQALPQASIGAIFRSRHVMAVGDPSQIRPVLTLDSSVLRLLRDHYGVTEKYLSVETSTQTLVDAASRYGYYRSMAADDPKERDQSWIGIPLWVHRRCQDPMFTISNKISYDGLMVQGNLQDPWGHTGWIDVKGKATDKYVPEQGDVLAALIQRKMAEGVGKEDIYVITPFRNVAYQLSRRLDRIRFTMRDDKGKAVNVGTIHTFQGKEALVVYLVLGADEHSKGAADWAVSDPNMMNVAATRAKKEFYIIGDKRLYKDRDSEVIDITLSVMRSYKKAHPDLIDEEVPPIPEKKSASAAAPAEDKAKAPESKPAGESKTKSDGRMTGVVMWTAKGKKSIYAQVRGDDGEEYMISESVFDSTADAAAVIRKGNKLSFLPQVNSKWKRRYMKDIRLQK